MAVKPQILKLWIVAMAAVASYGIASLILTQPVDNRENNKPPLASARAVVEGRPLPYAYFFDAKGKRKTVEDYKGKALLVNLWATWCTPCVAELPALDRLQTKLGTDKFAVIAISLDRADVKRGRGRMPQVLAEFLADKKVTAFSSHWDQDRVMPDKWNYDGIPTSFLLDRDGKVVEVFKGPEEWDAGTVFEKVAAVAK